MNNDTPTSPDIPASVALGAPDPLDASVVIGDAREAARVVLRADFLRAWIDGRQPYLRAAHLDRSVAIREVLPADSTIERAATDRHLLTVIARSGRASIFATVGVRSTTLEVLAASDVLALEVIHEISRQRRRPGQRGRRHRERGQPVRRRPTRPSAPSRGAPPAATTRLGARRARPARSPSSGRTVAASSCSGTARPAPARPRAVRTLMREWAPMVRVELRDRPREAVPRHGLPAARRDGAAGSRVRPHPRAGRVPREHVAARGDRGQRRVPPLHRPRPGGRRPRPPAQRHRRHPRPGRQRRPAHHHQRGAGPTPPRPHPARSLPGPGRVRAVHALARRWSGAPTTVPRPAARSPWPSSTATTTASSPSTTAAPSTPAPTSDRLRH